jgi:transposase
MRGEVLGVERRRRWGDEEKLSIVSSVGIDGATVTQAAHRCDVTRQQIYRWRHEFKKKGLWPLDEGTAFLPIDFHIGEMAAPESKPAPTVPL